jgi:hypothetical protein
LRRLVRARRWHTGSWRCIEYVALVGWIGGAWGAAQLEGTK